MVATFITHLNSISVGMCQGYSAVLLPQLCDAAQDNLVKNFNNELVINSEQATWIGTLSKTILY